MLLSQIRRPERYYNVDAAQKVTATLEAENQTADFDALFRTEYPKLARAIARIIRDPGRAEELAVEVFLKFSSASLPHQLNAVGWLHRTAARLGLDELRRQNRNGRLQAFFQRLKAPLNPEEVRMELDRQTRVGQVLNSLNRREAELLVLRAEGFSYEELGTALCINPTSIGTLLARAQQAFRKEYVKRYEQPE